MGVAFRTGEEATAHADGVRAGRDQLSPPAGGWEGNENPLTPLPTPRRRTKTPPRPHPQAARLFHRLRQGDRAHPAQDRELEWKPAADKLRESRPHPRRQLSSLRKN